MIAGILHLAVIGREQRALQRFLPPLDPRPMQQPVRVESVVEPAFHPSSPS